MEKTDFCILLFIVLLTSLCNSQYDYTYDDYENDEYNEYNEYGEYNENEDTNTADGWVHYCGGVLLRFELLNNFLFIKFPLQ